MIAPCPFSSTARATGRGPGTRPGNELRTDVRRPPRITGQQECSTHTINRVQVYVRLIQSLARTPLRRYIGRRLMFRPNPVVIALAALFLAGCGVGAAPARTLTARQALTQSPEWVEFETPGSRQDLFKDLARSSQIEAGQRSANDPVLFPVLVAGDLVAAPGFDARVDLLQAPDAGVFQLLFDSRSEHWSLERRESLQGLSEREAAELIARSLLHLWNIDAKAPVQVDRVTGAPYAAAYIDGILRINPAFVYLAATPTSEK